MHSAPDIRVSPLAADPEWFRELDLAEDRCRAYLEDLRWPEGASCPRCSSSETARIPARKRFWCRDCLYQFSVTSGTLLHNSHAPLWKWMLAVQLIVDSDGGLPANQLVRQLGGSYKTAWFIEHRVRAAFQESQGHQRDSERDGGQWLGGDRVYDRQVVGRYHQHGVKHLAAYRAEREWLAENGGGPSSFQRTMLALLEGEPLPYAELIRAGAAAAPLHAANIAG
jgi:transposase-like protein